MIFMNYMTFCTELIHELRRTYKQNLSAALIFGSYARLAPKRSSDIDLLIILKRDAEKDLLEIKKLAVKHLNTSIDIIIMSEKDFRSGIRKGDPLLVGAYSAYDPLISKVWLRKEFNKIKKIIKEKNISLMIGDLLWSPEALTS